MLATLFALLASLAWGTSDFLAGVASRRMSALGVALVTQAISVAALVVPLLLLGPQPPSAALIAVLVLGGAAGAVGVVGQYSAFTRTKLSVVSAIIAGAALLPALWGIVIGERPSAPQAAGIVLTVAGVIAVSRPAPEDPGEQLPVTKAGVLLALMAAAGVGTMMIALDAGGEADPYWAVVVVRGVATLAIAATVGATRPALRLRRRAWPAFLVIALLIAAANVLFTTATTMGDLGVVAVLGWTSPAVTLAWAALLLNERLRPFQWAAAAVVILGVALLAAG